MRTSLFSGAIPSTMARAGQISSMMVCPAPMDRQCQEKVKISNFRGAVVMNCRNELGGVRIERTKYRRQGGNKNGRTAANLRSPHPPPSCKAAGWRKRGLHLAGGAWGDGRELGGGRGEHPHLTDNTVSSFSLKYSLACRATVLEMELPQKYLHCIKK